MSLTVLASVFGIVFLAELPDKTALASLVLGTRYRASWVFAGVATAFVVHVALAITAGRLLALLPHRVLESVVAAIFLLGAVLLLRGRTEEDENIKETAASFWRVSTASFVVILIAEFGDLTQIVTANLAAKYSDTAAVALGAVLALWAVAGLAILGGQSLLRVLPMKWIIRTAAAIMMVLAGYSLYSAIHG